MWLVRDRDARLYLTEHRVEDECCPAARPDLARRGVQVPLAGVAKSAAGGKLEGGRDAIRAAMIVFQHVRGDDQSPPGEQALRRGEATFHEPQGEGASRLGDEPRERGGRQPFVGRKINSSYSNLLIN